MSAELTNRQAEVLEFVKRHMREHGYPPTIRATMTELKLKSPNAVMGHFKALEKKGFMRHDKANASCAWVPANDYKNCSFCGQPLPVSQQEDLSFIAVSKS